MNKRSFLITTASLAGAALGTGCAGGGGYGPAQTLVLPDAIKFTLPGLYPEGFAFDEAAGQFLVSSITEGDVYRVKPDGSIAKFISDTNLISSTGITIDAPRNRVIVATGDVNASKRSRTGTAYATSAVGIYDLSTGTRIAFHTLAGLNPNYGHFASDAAVDDVGNLYVTDSFAPVVYKIDSTGAKSAWLESPANFTPAANSFGLNGIVYHPAGFLIVSKTDQGFLYKIPLANPSAFQRIGVEAFAGVDGIALTGSNTLLLAINGSNKVVRLETSDAWATATKTGELITANVFPTTVNLAGREPYALHTYLNKLLSGDGSQANYQFQKVKF
jgi:SMP-30/Gluconolactonase/LRE-like region